MHLVSKRVLITGGTGFLGQRLGSELKARYHVVLAARNNKQNMLARENTGCEVLAVDVCNIESIRDAFAELRPAIVIHAAATKFVDLAERQPMECVDINVRGSQNVARVAMEHGAEILIGISTDKAAPPIRNTYGLSKALMERMFCSLDGKTDTKLACVRYGNVAWSTGSVLPEWKRMHERTGEIGTTGPQMRRFFFTIDEAVKVVETAIDSIDTIRGKVLARPMKAAMIKDLLDVWTSSHGGTWTQVEGRPGDREDEYLVGEAEVPFTSELAVDGVSHYLISFNERSPSPPAGPLSTATSERLTHDEMVRLVEVTTV
jgi:FlaA1/EpsC-like NDP-sugar epimerase